MRDSMTGRTQGAAEAEYLQKQTVLADRIVGDREKIQQVIDALEEHKGERTPDEFMHGVYQMFIDALRYRRQLNPTTERKLEVVLELNKLERR